MNKQWLKFAVGVIGFTAVIMSSAQSDAKNTVELKAIELGTSMKLWAVAFGASAKKNAMDSKQAFLNDVDRFQQSKFWQYQVNSWAQGQQDLAKTGESIKQLPQTLARVPGDIATGLVNFVRAVTGVKNANEEK